MCDYCAHYHISIITRRITNHFQTITKYCFYDKMQYRISSQELSGMKQWEMSIRQNRSARREWELLRRAPPEQGGKGALRAPRLISSLSFADYSLLLLSRLQITSHTQRILFLCAHTALCVIITWHCQQQRLKNALSTQKEDAPLFID
jgi:hypothetical protein